MKQIKSVRIDMRFAPKDINRIRMLADMYAQGNLTGWVTYAALNAPRPRVNMRKKGNPTG